MHSDVKPYSKRALPYKNKATKPAPDWSSLVQDLESDYFWIGI